MKDLYSATMALINSSGRCADNLLEGCSGLLFEEQTMLKNPLWLTIKILALTIQFYKLLMQFFVGLSCEIPNGSKMHQGRSLFRFRAPLQTENATNMKK